MSGYKYVPDGVFLACSQGTEISNLKITHVKDAHLYNNQLYATDRDVEPVNIGCFGNCRELNTKCKYQKGIWQKVHPTLSVEGAAPILDEISYLECPYKGKITIHFDKASAEAIANKNATEKDGINWGRIGNHLMEKVTGVFQGILLGAAIVGGFALIGGIIGAFAGGAGAVPGAVAGAKVGMAILTGLGITATVKSVSDTYKSGERLIESTNKAEDGIIFAIDLSETIIMMLGLKKGIKNFKKNSSKVGLQVGNFLETVLGRNTKDLSNIKNTTLDIFKIKKEIIKNREIFLKKGKDIKNITFSASKIVSENGKKEHLLTVSGKALLSNAPEKITVDGVEYKILKVDSNSVKTFGKNFNHSEKKIFSYIQDNYKNQKTTVEIAIQNNSVSKPGMCPDCWLSLKEFRTNNPNVNVIIYQGSTWTNK